MVPVIDLIGDHDIDAHSSVILTFAIDLPFYDGFVRRRLKNAGVVNQMVFCDLRMYQSELIALSAVRQFGRSYSVTPIHQSGAFHPKLYLLLGILGRSQITFPSRGIELIQTVFLSR